MAKKTIRKSVHQDDFQIKQEQEKFDALLEIKNKQLQLAMDIAPTFKVNSIDVLTEVGNYLKSKILNPRLSVGEAAKLAGFGREYAQLEELESEIDTAILKRYSRYIKFSKGLLVTSADFMEELTEQHTVYFTEPKAIELYEKVEKFIALHKELIESSWLSDPPNLFWRLSSSFPLVRVGGKTQLEPNWISIRNYMDV